jgi:hypothetical protein
MPKPTTLRQAQSEIRALKKVIRQKDALLDFFIQASPDWVIEEYEEIEMAQRGKKPCTDCGEEMPKRNKKCPFCGTVTQPEDEGYRFA